MSDDPRLTDDVIDAANVAWMDYWLPIGKPAREKGTRPEAMRVTLAAALTALTARAREQVAAMRTPAAERQVGARVEEKAMEAVAALERDLSEFDPAARDKRARWSAAMAMYLVRAGWRRTGRSE